jgi:hypothetical protein
MSKKPAPEPTEPESKRQTPFERFKAALAHVVAVPKASIQKAKPLRKKK